MVTFDCHSNIVYSDIEGCAFKPMAKLGFQISKLTLIGCLLVVHHRKQFKNNSRHKKRAPEASGYLISSNPLDIFLKK